MYIPSAIKIHMKRNWLFRIEVKRLIQEEKNNHRITLFWLPRVEVEGGKERLKYTFVAEHLGKFFVSFVGFRWKIYTFVFSIEANLYREETLIQSTKKNKKKGLLWEENL